MANCCQKFIILIFNFCTGGVGTIISPFFEKNCSCRNIIVAIIIGIVQILYFVHILSFIIKFKFIDDFYDIIGGENLLIPFMNDKYKNFAKNINNIVDNIEIEINPDEILSKNSRVSLLKLLLFILSGLSYINSNLSPFIDLIKNYQLDFKMITYGIFNPGAGVLISAILFFNGEKFYKIIISFIGVLFGIFLMTCPFILGIGLYLTIILKSVTNLMVIKIIAIYFGIIQNIYSLIFSFLQKDMNKDDSNELKTKETFDIDCECCSEPYRLKSDFGPGTIIRMIFNIIIPGSGIFSLMCKFGCHIGIFFIGLFQIISYLIIVLFIVFIIKHNDVILVDEDRNIIHEESEKALLFHGIFAFGLTHQVCGMIIIFISDYFKNIPKKYDGFSIFFLILLDILSGGYGSFLICIYYNSIGCKGKYGKCLSITTMIIHSLSGISIQLFLIVLTFENYEEVNGKIFQILFIVHNIITIIILCIGKNKKIEIDEFNDNQSSQNNINDGMVVLYI